jgi:hypothetical protein
VLRELLSKALTGWKYGTIRNPIIYLHILQYKIKINSDPDWIVIVDSDSINRQPYKYQVLSTILAFLPLNRRLCRRRHNIHRQRLPRAKLNVSIFPATFFTVYCILQTSFTSQFTTFTKDPSNIFMFRVPVPMHRMLQCIHIHTISY